MKTLLKGSGSIEEILGQLVPVNDEKDHFSSMAEDDSAIVQLVNKMIMDACNRVLRISISNPVREETRR